MPRNWFARPAAVCGLVTLALLVAACGGSTAAVAPTTTTTTARGSGANRLAAFRACMSSHGVTLPANARLGGGRGGGPGAGAGGTDTTGPAPTTTIPAGVTEQQWNTAIAACQATIPRGNLQNNPQFQLYYNCLNSYLSTHGGTTLPPLGAGGAGAGALFGGRGGTASGNTTTTNPTMQAAIAHCTALRPTLGGGTTTSTSVG